MNTPQEIVEIISKFLKIKKVDENEQLISLFLSEKIVNKSSTVVTIKRRNKSLTIDAEKNEITISDGSVSLTLKNKYPIATILNGNKLIRIMIFKRDPDGDSLGHWYGDDGGDPVTYKISTDDKGQLKVDVVIDIDKFFDE